MNRDALLLLLVAPLFALAAPVPKDEVKAKIEKKYGTIVDPKGDSKFELDGDALKITLPADKSRGYGFTEGGKGKADKKFDHTPRVEFTQTGDFVLTVRVNTPLASDAGKCSEDGGQSLGAGFRFTPKDGDWVRFGVEQSYERGKLLTTFPLDSPGCYSNSGGRTGFSYKGFGGETVCLRATRKGKTITREASTDGKTWREESSVACVTPDETITISLYALHHSDKAHTVTFDQFSVEKPKAEKK